MLNPPKVNRLTSWMIQRSEQSWWQVQYAGGRVLSEWDTVKSSSLFSLKNSSTSRWEEIPKKGLRGLFLLCPNGKAAALESNGDYLFFQLKVGHISIGAGTTRSCSAHIIGKVDGDDGRCVCYAWEYKTQKLVRFTDNVTFMAYENIGPLALDVVGLR